MNSIFQLKMLRKILRVLDGAGMMVSWLSSSCLLQIYRRYARSFETV
jgi:hypothetical protein